MAATILIADDDAVQRRLVENMVQKCGYETAIVDSGDAAVEFLTGPDGQGIDCLVLDLVMPGLDGMGVLAKIRDAGLTLPVIVQTAHGGIDNVVSAMRAGAQDFVVKPVGMERLQVSLRNALNTSALKGELQRIRHSREGRLTFADIITRSDAMRGVLRMAEKAAGSAIPVLIEGESGVGKELIARAIHGSGERRAISRRPVLPPARAAADRAAAACTPRGRPAPAAAFSRALPGRGKSRHRQRGCRSAGRARELCLARERPPARERGLSCRRHQRA